MPYQDFVKETKYGFRQDVRGVVKVEETRSTFNGKANAKGERHATGSYTTNEDK